MEIYSVKSMMQSTIGKVAHLYENSEPYNIINGFHRELDVAYSKILPLCGPKEEEEELWIRVLAYMKQCTGIDLLGILKDSQHPRETLI